MAVLGVIPPPPGVTANIDHPQRKGRLILVLSGVGMALSSLFLLMRIFTKLKINRSFGYEDVCIIFAWVFSVTVVSITIVLFEHAGEGRHMWDITDDTYASFQKLIMASSIIYVPTLACAKMSLLLLFHRITPEKHRRFMIHIVMTIVVGYSIALIIVLLFSCRPIAKAWDYAAPGTCINRPAIYIATAVINIATDLAILTLPIPMVAKLKLPLQQKIGLGCMFAVGSLTAITSIVRLVTLFPLLTAIDQTWVVSVPSYWIIIEANLVIICCCLVSVKSFLRHFAPTLIGEKPNYGATSYVNSFNRDAPRSNGLVITKDVSFNLTWQDDSQVRIHDYPGNEAYVEMDNMKTSDVKLHDDKSLTESQEAIMAAEKRS